jgi:hypothetical protein
MKNRKITTDFFILFLFIATIVICHYFSPNDNVFLHSVFRKLYYIPIIYAAFRLGPLGVAVTAFISSFFYMLRIWPPPAQLGTSWILDNTLEIILYIVAYTGPAGKPGQSRFRKSPSVPVKKRANEIQVYLHSFP